jgi:hypothetical protein
MVPSATSSVPIPGNRLAGEGFPCDGRLRAGLIPVPTKIGEKIVSSLKVRGVVAHSVAVIALSGAVASAAVPAASAATHAAAHSSWHVVGNLGGKDVFAYAPVNSTSTWVFEQPTTGSERPTAWLVHDSALTKYAFPSVRGESMTGGAAAGTDDVWAISLHRAFAWNGSSWRVVRSFAPSVYLYSVLPLSSGGTLLFTSDGTWYYGGPSWSREPSGWGLVDASALSATSVWAVSRAHDVAHWNGRTWTKTSLARLLPRSPDLCEYGLTGVDAVSARNVWVLASGNCQDAGGPLVLLHYTGHRWAKAPLTGSYGTSWGAAPDGSGLWLTISGGAGGKSSFYRYSAGKMTAARLPIPSRPAMLLNPPATTSGPHPVTYLLATAYTQPYIHPTTYLLRYGS